MAKRMITVGLLGGILLNFHSWTSLLRHSCRTSFTAIIARGVNFKVSLKEGVNNINNKYNIIIQII